MSSKKITPNNFVKEFFSQWYETTNAKRLEEDHGRMFRRDNILGDGAWTVGVSYYYESLARPELLVEEMKKFADEYGFTVTQTSTPMFFRKPWPKTSWCKMQIKVEVKS